MKFFLRTLFWSSVPLLILYATAPFLVFLFPHFMQHLFFLNFGRCDMSRFIVLVKIPYRNYHNLTAYGIEAVGTNFYVPGGSSSQIISLGAWHILPKSLSTRFKGEPNEKNMEQELAKSEKPVVLYLHGNSFDRTTTHRVELYKILSNMDFHVIAFDYRGYGDSTGRPTEDGIVNDAHTMYDYIRSHVGHRPVLIWGHSMGTGVATRMVAELSEWEKPPLGLVLESPFNNLPDVIHHHPFSTPFRFLPWFDDLVVKPLMESGLVMNSDTRISKISCPILVLHAEDDHIIPLKLGERLVQAAKAAAKDVELVVFGSDRGLFHKYIHKAPEVPSMIKSQGSDSKK